MTDGPASWDLTWETAVPDDDHEALACLLTLAFPATRTLGGRRSWAGARPELRVVGRLDGRPVAHAGVIRRFLRSPGGDGASGGHDPSTLVGDVGLVAVHPERRHRALGVELMAAVTATLARLEVPYGFLTCHPRLRPFYERCGWTALVDHPVCTVRVHHDVEGGRANGMLLPVTRPVAQWPPGPIVRDGREI